jgi:probable HAF family extracellular repeat protein
MGAFARLSAVFFRLCLLVGAFTVAVAWAQVSTAGNTAPAEKQSSQVSSRPGGYTITDVGAVGEVTALNDHGQVAGYTADYPNNHAILWQDGKMTDLGTLGGASSSATRINGNGEIVGASQTPAGNNHAFLWQNGKMTDIDPGDPENSQGNGINNEGQIVGYRNANGRSHAFLWQGGQSTDLGGLDIASSINNRGQIVGGSVLWQNGKLTNLGTLGGPSTSAGAINNNGQVVGAADVPPSYPHAFLWQDGKMTDLGTLGGFESAATAINDNGQIVGFSDTGFKPRVAFLWQNGQMADLNGLVYGAADWTFEGATGINNLGQIVGNGSRNGQIRGFLLTPLHPGSGNGKLSLSSSSWTFSAHPVGQTSRSGTIYLTSTGSGDLNIQQIRVGALSRSDTPDDFKIIANTCFPPGSNNLSEPVPTTLTPNESCALTFDFTPSLAGGRTADIVVYDDAPDGPHAIPLEGVGLGKGVLILSNTFWLFANHPVGQSSSPGAIYVYNSGTEAIHFSSVAISGANASDFALTSNACSPILAAHATCAARFVFTPSAPGGRSAALVFADDSASSTQTVTLAGFGK